MQEGTPCGTRTRNLRIRSPTPCPLGQGGMLQPRMSRHPSYYSHAPPCYINNKSQTRLREELPTCCGAFIIHAHAGSRARVTSMGGLYDAATLHALLHKGPYLDKVIFGTPNYWPQLRNLTFDCEVQTCTPKYRFSRQSHCKQRSTARYHHKSK